MECGRLHLNDGKSYIRISIIDSNIIIINPYSRTCELCSCIYQFEPIVRGNKKGAHWSSAQDLKTFLI